jgi:hypothetical protein
VKVLCESLLMRPIKWRCALHVEAYGAFPQVHCGTKFIVKVLHHCKLLSGRRYDILCTVRHIIFGRSTVCPIGSRHPIPGSIRQVCLVPLGESTRRAQNCLELLG